MFVIRAAPLVAVLALACAPSGPFVPTALEVTAPTPVDASHAVAKRALLARLEQAQAGGTMLSGQHYGTADSPAGTWRRDRSQLTVGSREVAMAGLEFSYSDFSNIRDDAIDELIEWSRRGGIVTINAAPLNPATGGSPWDRSVVDLAAVADPSTAAGANWEVMTTNLALKLQRLKDAHVIVLFRPLNEVNGDWFWWGRGDVSAYRTVWRRLHEKLVTARALDNLLWVYAPAKREDEAMPQTDAHFPGADVVDVVGLSYYTKTGDDLDAHGGWAALAALGKPMAVAEHGPPPNSPLGANGSFDYRGLVTLRAKVPFSYFLAWSSWPGNKVAMRDTTHGTALLEAPEVINLK